jgi:hypothetical protein
VRVTDCGNGGETTLLLDARRRSERGDQQLVETVKKMRSLDPVSLHFIAAISHTPLSEFRCYNTRYLTQGHWIY